MKKKRIVIFGSIAVGLLVMLGLGLRTPLLRILLPSTGIEYFYDNNNELSECFHDTAFGCATDLKCKLQETAFSFGGVQYSCCPRDESDIPKEHKCLQPIHYSDVVPIPELRTP